MGIATFSTDQNPPTPGPPRRQARDQHPRGRFLRIAFALTIISTFAWFAWRHYSSFQWTRFFDALGLIDHQWLIAGLCLAVLSYAGRAVRWQAMMLPVRSSFSTVFSATLIGFSAVVVLGRAGELIRPYLIARKERTDLPLQAGVWVLERLYDFLVIVLLFGIGISHTRKMAFSPDVGFQAVIHAGGWIVAVGATAAGVLLYIIGSRPEFFRRRISLAITFLPEHRQNRVLQTLDSFLRGASTAGRAPTMLLSIALTLAEWGLILCSVWCYFRAFPPASDFTLLDVAAFLGFVAFGAIIQLPGIGGGMQIASVVVLTELFHLPVELASGFSLLIWAGSNLIVLPFGIPLALYQGLKLKELRRIGDEAPL